MRSRSTELEEAVARGAREILRGEHVALLLPPVREGVQASRLLVRDDEVFRANVSPDQLTSDLSLLLPRQRGPAVHARASRCRAGSARSA